MKTLVIRSSKYSSKFITTRNLCIWDIRRRRHIKFKDIAIQFGISTNRAQQIYEKMQRAYERGAFHYEDIDQDTV